MAEDGTTGMISCDICGNEITLEQEDKDFVCDNCGAQVCCECISSKGNICGNCNDEEE